MKNLLFYLFTLSTFYTLQAETYLLPNGEQILDGKDNYNFILPGDSIILQGSASFLIIRNFAGTKEAPIVFTNQKGSVFNIASEIGFGVSIQNSKHVILSGQKVGELHGIKVAVPNGSGIGVGYLSEEWELNGIEVGPTKSPGILAKTDPNCDFNSTREKFVQSGGKILNCFIHDTGTEGIYFGSTAYNGLKVNCNGKDTTLMPHFILNGEIAYNTVVNSGWDGIQMSSTLNGKVHHNTVLSDSRSNQSFQKNGIITGRGFSGEVYSNIVLNGEGNGIFSMGRDSLFYENNIIFNPGYSSRNGGQFGIYVSIDHGEAKYLQVNNNLIANPRFQAFHCILGSDLSDAIFVNNIISYNDSLHGKKIEDIISTPRAPLTLNATNHITEENNLYNYYYLNDSLDQRQNGFTVNQGTPLSLHNPLDYYDRNRIDISGKIDIGPFEYHPTTSIIKKGEIDRQCISALIQELKKGSAQLLIYHIDGKNYTGYPVEELKKGIYILTNIETGCSAVINNR
ncbi:right-handed parallel beta-helix repeat-containing protein [Luteibaculum oceani]|uniref:Right-handed parallel beta-helix repeat-containing protein n=1 Tax=Luteibaculum oceani TaxID=1294296 RepID=A0A5C6UVY5_9FLAO|nr:right-handed parallel beta-helix repeat-containing protein [Luteibaculum oceani]TXC77129.1 right-handed parallel beta-helix repeat-containing protein [Luteibaculum oceani]